MLCVHSILYDSPKREITRREVRRSSRSIDSYATTNPDEKFIIENSPTALDSCAGAPSCCPICAVDAALSNKKKSSSFRWTAEKIFIFTSVKQLLTHPVYRHAQNRVSLWRSQEAHQAWSVEGLVSLLDERHLFFYSGHRHFSMENNSFRQGERTQRIRIHLFIFDNNEKPALCIDRRECWKKSPMRTSWFEFCMF